MSMYKTVKGLAVGTSLAAFVTLGGPAIGNAADLLAGETIEQTADPAPKKKDDKKKKEGEGSCGADKKKKDGEKGEGGEGACGEGSCGDKKK